MYVALSEILHHVLHASFLNKIQISLFLIMKLELIFPGAKVFQPNIYFHCFFQLIIVHVHQIISIRVIFELFFYQYYLAINVHNETVMSPLKNLH